MIENVKRPREADGNRRSVIPRPVVDCRHWNNGVKHRFHRVGDDLRCNETHPAAMRVAQPINSRHTEHWAQLYTAFSQPTNLGSIFKLRLKNLCTYQHAKESPPFLVTWSTARARLTLLPRHWHRLRKNLKAVF